MRSIEGVVVWMEAAVCQPKQYDIVLVLGGIAQYRDGVFYTGMTPGPHFTRPIIWDVTHWAYLPTPPRSPQGANA